MTKHRLLSAILSAGILFSTLPPGMALATDLTTSKETNAGIALTAIDDHIPPVVTGAHMNTPGIVVKPGDKLEFIVSAEDNESGIKDGRLDFTYICDQGYKHDGIHTYYMHSSYNKNTKQLKIFLTITDDMRNGTYKLSSVSVFDNQDSTDYNFDNPGPIDFDSIYFTITDAVPHDHTPSPPYIEPTISMKEPGKIVTPGDTIEITAFIGSEDEWILDRSYLIFRYVCDQDYGHEIRMRFSNDGSYNSETREIKFTLPINDDMVNGTYKLRYAQIGGFSDDAKHESSNIDFDAIYFTVTGTSVSEDHTPPTITSVSMEEPGKTVTLGDKVEITVFTENKSGVNIKESSLGFTYICDEGYEHEDIRVTADSYDNDTKQVKFILPVTDDMLNGKHQLTWVHIDERTEHGDGIDIDSPADIDLTPFYFIVSNSIAPHDHTPPTVTAVTMKEPGVVVKAGDRIKFTVSAEDESEISIFNSKLYFTYVCDQGYKHSEIETLFVWSSYSKETKQLELILPTYDDYPNGTYTLSRVEISDELHHNTIFTPDSPGPIDFDSVWFVVDTPDKKPVSTPIGSGRDDRTDNKEEAPKDTPKEETPSVEKPTFADVKAGAWYADAVSWAAEKGIINGYDNGLFSPNNDTTREEFSVMLWRCAEKPTSPNPLLTFSDKDRIGGYAQDAIAWASQKGIINGYDNGSFRPNDDITREQLAVMLWRYADSPAPPNLLLTFSDTDKISSYAQDALRWAVDKGIIKGNGNGALNPTGKATRAEVAQMLKNYMDSIQ